MISNNGFLYVYVLKDVKTLRNILDNINDQRKQKCQKVEYDNSCNIWSFEFSTVIVCNKVGVYITMLYNLSILTLLLIQIE